MRKIERCGDYGRFLTDWYYGANRGRGGLNCRRRYRVDDRRDGRCFSAPALHAWLVASEPLADAALRSLCENEKTQTGYPGGRSPGELAGGFDGSLDVGQ